MGMIAEMLKVVRLGLGPNLLLARSIALHLVETDHSETAEYAEYSEPSSAYSLGVLMCSSK